MKLSIDAQEYEISEDCLLELLEIGKKLARKADLSEEILEPILELDRLEEESLISLAEKLMRAGLGMYHNLSTIKRLAAIQACRWLIAHVEMRMNNPEAAKVLRPPKRKDPIEHVVSVFYPMIEYILIPEILKLKNATIEVNAQHNTIASIKLKEDSSWGEVVTNGYKR